MKWINLAMAGGLIVCAVVFGLFLADVGAALWCWLSTGGVRC